MCLCVNMLSTRLLVVLVLVGVVAAHPYKKKGDTVCIGFEVPRRDSGGEESDESEEQQVPRQDAASSNPLGSLADIPNSFVNMGRGMFDQYNPMSSAPQMRQPRHHRHRHPSPSSPPPPLSSSLKPQEEESPQGKSDKAVDEKSELQQSSSTTLSPLSSAVSKRSPAKASKLF